MSVSKIEKFLAKPLPAKSGRLIRTPILLSDSKGRYLKDQFRRDSVVEIKFDCLSGFSTEDAVYHFESKLTEYLQTFGAFTLYVWLGTCDLTYKEGRFIHASLDSDPVSRVVRQYRKLIRIVNRLADCDIKFLEIPPISVILYNKSKNYPTPDIFVADDRLVDGFMKSLNIEIKLLNGSLNQPTLGY